MQVQTEKGPLMNSPFSAFINLISLDQEIRTLQEKIIKFKEETAALLSHEKELNHRLKQFQQHVLDLRHKVSEQEYELKELDQQERTKKEQFDQLKGPKQYQYLKREIDRLKQTQHEKENYLLSTWNKLDTAQKEFDEHQAHYGAKLSELGIHVQEKKQQVALTEQQLEIKKQERPFKEIGIPAEWLEKYTLMRSRVSDPVVSVAQGGCNACSYPATEQELVRLKRKALIQCKGCFRLLYMQEAMDDPQTPPAKGQ